MAYLFWTFVHIIGVFGFQYTGIEWFLVLSALHVSISMLIFIFGVAAALTPNFIVENLDASEHKDFGPRFLMQFATIVTAAQLFIIGYEFFAGLVVMHGTILCLSVAMQKLFDKEE